MYPHALFEEYEEDFGDGSFGYHWESYHFMMERCFHDKKISASSENCKYDPTFEEYCLKIIEIVHRETDGGKLFSEYLSSMYLQVIELIRIEPIERKRYSSDFYKYLDAHYNNPLCEIFVEELMLSAITIDGIPINKSIAYDKNLSRVVMFQNKYPVKKTNKYPVFTGYLPQPNFNTFG